MKGRPRIASVNLNGSCDDIVKQTKRDYEDLKRRLLEVAREDKPYFDILNGFIPTFDSDTPKEPEKPVRRENVPSEATELVRDVRKYLADHGRTYSFEDVANFLVCIHQNFLTVFAGLPGVGKTSLVEYLALALGLKLGQRFSLVSTARGWTSQRDLLGFFNPLNQDFQPAPTGLYYALEACQDEIIANEDQQFPYWVLLDEANLSPIEHYFSAFLGMCDKHFSRTINTGEQSKADTLIVPKGFRFLATINYDNTTEPLSRRMIDRVPVVLIDPPEGG